MIELLVVCVITAAAAAMVCARTDLSWFGCALLAPVVGISTYVSTSLVVMFVARHARPSLAVASAVIVLVAIAAPGAKPVLPKLVRAVAGASSLGAAIGLASLVTRPTRLSPDSLRYVIAADLMAETGVTSVNPLDLVKRGFTTPAIQMLGSWDDRPFSVIAVAVTLAGGLAFATWVVDATLRRWRVRRPMRTAMVTLMFVFAATTGRVVYDGHYINSHGYLIAACGAIVCLASLADRMRGHELLVGMIAAPVLTARAEGFLIVMVIVVPVVARLGVSRRLRLLAVAPSIVVVVLWTVLIWDRAPGSRSDLTGDAVTGTLVVMAAMSVLALVKTSSVSIGALAARLPWLIPLALILFAGVEGARDPDIFFAAVSATGANLAGQGGWGFAWLILLPLALMAYRERYPTEAVFGSATLGFMAIFWLLPFVREGAYRVGEGDSGNRLLAHGFLVTLCHVVLSAGWSLGSTGGEAVSQSPEPMPGPADREIEAMA